MGMGSKSLNEEETPNDVESEDWCFVCHDGGKLRECDFLKCGKAYHYKCVGQKRSFLKSEVEWNCGRHSCYCCCGRSMISCYMCPKAVCDQCIYAAGFARVRQENGFCKDCMEFVLDIEESMEKGMNLKDLSTTEGHLKEYYEIIKKQEGLTLDDLQSAKGRWKILEKRKSSLSLDDVNENKRHKGLQEIKLKTNKTNLREEVVRNIPAISFASLVPQNVRLIYLTKSLVQKLLKQPESFEDKVKGTFVRVGLSSNNMRRRKAHQILQVTGITKISSDGDSMDIMLQASNVPHDISIDMISDSDFSEKECEDLRQQAEVGLLKKPTVEELELKARILREDVVDDMIARELRKLQPKMDLANEKGRRRDYLEFMNKKKQLEAPSERLRLIHNLPMVIEEPPSEGTMNDRQENECPPESIPTKEGEYTINCDKLSEGLRSSFPVNNVAADDKTTLEIDLENVAADALDSRPVLKDVMANKKRNEASPNLISEKEYEGRETTSVASAPAQENVREQVYETRPLIPLTTNREPNVDLELPQLEIKKNKVIQEQESKGERTATEQPVESINHTHTQQQSMRSIPPSLEGRNVIPANDRNPATVQQSNHECCPRRELDILKLSHFNSSRNITMLEDELKRLKAKMEEDAHESATKITRLEKKLDQMFEQSAKEAITSYKESQIAKDDVKKFLDPIYREAWTEALEEVKAKHLPDLDLSRFPRYDPKAGDKVDLVVKQICRTFIQVGHVMSQEATEKNCSVPNSEQHHLSPQGQEQQHPSPRATVEDGKFLEVPARIPQGANDECSEPNPEAWKKMHLLKKICLSSIQIDHGMSQEATEKKCSKPNAEQHLTTQAREVERSFLDGKVIEKIPAPDLKQATGDSSELKPEQQHPTATTQAREVERTVEDDKVQGIPSPFPQE